MGVNRRRLEREQVRAREVQRRKDDDARQAEIADAVAFIEAWNARLAADRPLMFSPTLRAAALAGYRWLTVHCGGCGMVSDVDLTPSSTVRERLPRISLRSCGLRERYSAVHPPSSTSAEPVISDEASEARNRTAPVISSSWPRRPSLIFDRTSLRNASF